MQTWQERMMVASVLYLIMEKNHTFETTILGNIGKKSNDGLLANVIKEMETVGLLKTTGFVNKKYIVTDKGREQMRKFIGVLDGIRQFNPCISVDLRELTPDEWLSEEAPAEVRWDILDPRFLDSNDENGVDMRIALIQWAGYKLGKEIDPHEVVFLFRLGSGMYSGPDFYFRLLDGSLFSDVEYTVSNSFKWQEMDPEGNLDVASRRMECLYSACMIENQKLDCFPCGGCGAPMAMFVQDAKRQGCELTECPCCGRQFPPAPVDSFVCPRCDSLMYPGDSVCSGCGAMVDLSLPMGASCSDTTVTETDTVVFAQDYGYYSCGWFDPYNVLVTACVFDVLYDPYW